MPAARRTSTRVSGSWPGSFISALLAAIVLRARNHHYRRLHLEEERDIDADGVPDVYQRPH